MQTLWEFLLSNAMVATLLAAVAALATRCCRRPPVVHALWLLVLLKLVTPPVLCVPLGLLPFPTQNDPLLEVPTSARKPQSSIETDWPDAGDSWRPLSRAGESDSFQELADALPQDDRAARSSLPFEPTLPLVRVPGGEGEGGLPPPVASMTSRQAAAAGTWWTIERDSRTRALLLGAWVAGTCVWLSLVLVRLTRFCGAVSRTAVVDCKLQRQADRIARRFGLRRAPTVKLVEAAVSPMLWAMHREPTILLPLPLIGRLSAEQCATLLAHELAHYCRRDHWVRWLEIVVLTLFWWHPIVWLACRELHKAEEQCCDAWVLWALPKAQYSYARAILATIDFLVKDSRPTPALASGLGPVPFLERRFEMILHARPAHRLSALARAAVLLAGLFVLPLSALAQKEAPPTPTAQKPRTSAAVETTAVPAPPVTSQGPEPALQSDALFLGADLAPKTEEAKPAAGDATIAPPPVAQVPVSPRLNEVQLDLSSQSEAPQDLEHRLQRLEKMVESLVANSKPAPNALPATKTAVRLYSQRPATATREILETPVYSASVMTALRSGAASLSELKKQRIDVEESLLNLKERLAQIDDEIGKLQGERDKKASRENPFQETLQRP